MTVNSGQDFEAQKSASIHDPALKILTSIHCHYKAWKSQDIFQYNSDCIRLKEESQIHLGWLKHE